MALDLSLERYSTSTEDRPLATTCKSGKHLLRLSFSGFDPQETSERNTVASQRERWRCTATPFRALDCASGFGCEKFPCQILTSTRASSERSVRGRVRRPGG